MTLIPDFIGGATTTHNIRLIICRRGWSPTGGAERFLLRFSDELLACDISSQLVVDSRCPMKSLHGQPIIPIDSTNPEVFASEAIKIKARDQGAILFSMERLPGANVFRAGDGIHSAWLDRLAAEEGGLRNWFRRCRKKHRQLLRLEHRLFQDRMLRVIANSRMVADELIAIHGFPNERIAVIPNGYDPVYRDKETIKKTRAALRSQLGIPVHAVVFLFVGSGWKRKGAQFLVDSFRVLNDPNTWLILVGKGRVARAAHPRIHLAGPVTDPTDWFFAADVFALPTLYDPFSNACLEAACHGLPIITTDANGFKEVLEQFPHAGQVVPTPRSVADWGEALRQWLNPALRDGATPSLQAIRDHFTMKRNVEATVDFIRRSFHSS